MSDHAWWTPARRKLYGRPTVNGITCQICGCDMCQCNRLVPVSDPPRTATIGEHVDAVLAAKDAEIERLRQFLARANADHDRACDALAAATRERDEAVALLRVVREWYRCPWKHGASVEVIDLQRHAEWIARLDALLGGRDA